jgi:hypothetical protein
MLGKSVRSYLRGATNNVLVSCFLTRHAAEGVGLHVGSDQNYLACIVSVTLLVTRR